MSEDTEYNGWSNYPTWNVNLWLSNERDTYDAINDIVIECAGNRLWVLADTIEQFVEENVISFPESGTSFDLFNWAFEQVNWHEIAKAWISDGYTLNEDNTYTSNEVQS